MAIPRALGESIPISIGTAIPFETAIVSDLKKPSNVYFNLRTLVRNYIESYSKEDLSPNSLRVDGATLLNQLFKEIDTITSLCRNQRITSIIYLPTYRSIHRLFKNAKFKYPYVKITDDSRPTSRQLFQNTVMEKLIQGLVNNGLKYSPSDVGIPLVKSNSWVVTHIMVDMLMLPLGCNISLLESYTGAIRGPSEWMGKITKDPTITHFPFNRVSLMIFGDKTVMGSARVGVKRSFIRLGKERQWNSLTTLSSMKEDISRISEPSIRSALLEYF